MSEQTKPKYFSQYDEEPAIVEAVQGIPNGRLLDIGAWAPEEKSNSRRLIMSGWKAVLIEPSPASVKSLAAYYDSNPDVTVVAAAVGLESGLTQLELSDDAVSTSSHAHYELWKATTKFYGQAWYLTLTPETIAFLLGAFDFINIDTERTSVDLARRMVVDLRWEPRCYCVEHDDRLSELCEFMTAGHYRLTYSNGTNAVFTQ